MIETLLTCWINNKPKFTSYQDVLLRQRISLLPPRKDFASQIPPMVYVFSFRSHAFEMSYLADVMAAGVQQCASRGDVEAFRQIATDWRYLGLVTTNDSLSLFDGLAAKRVVITPVLNLRDAARKLGLKEEAEYFTKFEEHMQQKEERRKQRLKVYSSTEKRILNSGSSFAQIILPALYRQVEAPPTISERELRPGRLAEEAVLNRVRSWMVWVVLAIAAGVAAIVVPYRHSLLARKLSALTSYLLSPVDWLWILTGGVVFPLLWYFFISSLTLLPLPGFNPKYFTAQTVGQTASLAFCLIIAPAVIASWRLAKRGRGFGLAPRSPAWGWCAIFAALASVPAYGASTNMENHSSFLRYGPFILSGLAAAWILFCILLHLFSRRSQSLRRSTLARIVWPAWVVAMLLLAGLVPYHYLQERHWMQQDTLTLISPEFPSASRYEYEVTQILKSELREMLAPHE